MLGREKHEDVVGLIRSFIRLAERTSADFGARGRRDGMFSRYQSRYCCVLDRISKLWDD